MNDQQPNHTLFKFMSLYDDIADYSWSSYVENTPGHLCYLTAIE
jgi:hypothetical protein